MNRGFRRYKKVTPDSKNGVDLGLTGLINPEADANSPSSEAESSVPANSDSNEDPATRLPRDEKNEYEKLAVTANWAELATLCEQRLSDHEAAPFSIEDDELRVWWIKSQIASGSVPMAIIAAPLDSLTRGLCDKIAAQGKPDTKGQKICSIAASLLMDVAAAMCRAPDAESPLEFIERAYRLDPAYASELRSLVQKAIAKLPEDVRLSPDSPRMQRLLKLSTELAVPALSCRPAQSVTKITPAEERAPVEKAMPQPPQRQEVQQAPLLPPPAVQPRSLNRFLMPGAVVVLVLIVILKLAYSFFAPEAELAGNAMLGMLRDDRSAAVMAPQIERIAGMSQLDAVFYDIQHSPPRNQSAKNYDSPRQPDASASTSTGTRTRESVNTSSPVEPPEVAERTSGRRGSPSSQQSAGRAEPDKADSPSSGSEDFSSARLYEVIAPTSVMSEPSIRGEILADLKTGDKLMVEGKEGYWLRVRSRKDSKPGYVLGQDAVPEKSW